MRAMGYDARVKGHTADDAFSILHYGHSVYMYIESVVADNSGSFLSVCQAFVNVYSPNLYVER